MFNLLPEEDKKIIRTEYSRRLISVALGGVLIIWVASLLLLTPMLINVYSASNNTKTELDALKNKPASNDYRDLENTIKDAKKATSILKDEISLHPHIAEMITQALDNRPKGVLIDSIVWFNDSSGLRLNLNGIASTRELLRKYVLALQSNKAFSGVDIPVSDFAKSEKADFSITVKFNINNQ